MADLITITVDSSDVVKATQYTNELTAANDRLEKELKPLLAKEKEFQRAIRQVNEAMRLNVITNKQAIAQVQALGKQYGYTQQQIDRATASMTGIRKNTNRMNATIQNAGYQFGDFFVQVQSGQNALVAFSQQGAQLAGLLPGLAGAVAGVGLVLGSMLARALMESGALMKSFVGESEDAQKSLERLIGSTSRLADVVDKDLGAAITNYSRAMNELDLKRATEDARAQMEALEGALRTSKALENYTFGLSKGKFKAAYQEISDETRKAANALKEMEDLDFDNLEQVEGRLSFITGLLTNLTKETGLSSKNFDSLRQTADLLSERAEQLRESVGDTADASGEVVDEFAAQQAHLEAILKLEQARDRIAGSLEQKFANSTRRLELLKSGMSAGQAGKAVSMENMIADAVAAERALQSQLMNPLELQKYMGDFENALKVRLKGFNDEQVAAEELLKARRKLATATKETLPASIYGQAIGPEMPKAGSRAGFDITSAAEENRKQIERQIELAGLLSGSFLGAFRDIANGTETASDAFKKMSITIVEHILEILIWKPLIESLTNALSPTAVGGGAIGGLLSGLFPAANGAAINNGNVVPFAYGGVVNSPTLFGMSGGRTGLMGEAGPEAILPLKRGAGGKLGVEGGGNVTVHQSFNFAANGDESVKKIIAEAAPGIAKMTEAQIVNSRQRGGQMRRVFS